MNQSTQKGHVASHSSSEYVQDGNQSSSLSSQHAQSAMVREFKIAIVVESSTTMSILHPTFYRVILSLLAQYEKWMRSNISFQFKIHVARHQSLIQTEYTKSLDSVRRFLTTCFHERVSGEACSQSILEAIYLASDWLKGRQQCQQHLIIIASDLHDDYLLHRPLYLSQLLAQLNTVQVSFLCGKSSLPSSLPALYPLISLSGFPKDIVIDYKQSFYLNNQLMPLKQKLKEPTVSHHLSSTKAPSQLSFSNSTSSSTISSSNSASQSPAPTTLSVTQKSLENRFPSSSLPSTEGKRDITVISDRPTQRFEKKPVVIDISQSDDTHNNAFAAATVAAPPSMSLYWQGQLVLRENLSLKINARRVDKKEDVEQHQALPFSLSVDETVNLQVLSSVQTKLVLLFTTVPQSQKQLDHLVKWLREQKKMLTVEKSLPPGMKLYIFAHQQNMMGAVSWNAVATATPSATWPLSSMANNGTMMGGLENVFDWNALSAANLHGQ